MKQFFKFMFASMLGFFLMWLIVTFVFFIMMISIASLSEKEEVAVPTNSIVQIKLNQEIPERTPSNPFENFDFGSMKANVVMGLNDILKNIEKAKNDPNVKGIYLDLTEMPGGIATIEEIRDALLDFRTSGKFVYSYAEVYTQKTYYLASVSSKIFINPEGALDWKGLNAALMFFKGTLEKLEVKPQIVRGKNNQFKSAVEPFIYDKMSEANRKQYTAFLNSLWGHWVNNISKSRNISVQELNLLADSMKIETPKDAYYYKLVDSLVYKDELLDIFRKKLNIKDKQKLSFVSLERYSKVPEKAKKMRIKEKIAVIYAQGSIESGEGSESVIGSEKISKAIRDARQDSSVKAIVLRVNSPGGSALASEVIWREMILAKKVKPVIVSMGDLAASGGYYISCSADRIIANPTTLTGSIGVYGIIPNMQGFFNKKLGITFDNVKTHSHSDFAPASRPLSDFEMLKLQNMVDRIYETFKSHVSEGRNIPIATVDSIGQGRVWSGVEAKQIGLIDDFGGLKYAIEYAAEKAKLKDYRIIEYPKKKDFFQQIIDELSGNSDEVRMQKVLGEHYQMFKYIKYINSLTGVQALMPYWIQIE